MPEADSDIDIHTPYLQIVSRQPQLIRAWKSRAAINVLFCSFASLVPAFRPVPGHRNFASLEILVLSPPALRPAADWLLQVETMRNRHSRVACMPHFWALGIYNWAALNNFIFLLTTPTNHCSLGPPWTQFSKRLCLSLVLTLDCSLPLYPSTCA